MRQRTDYHEYRKLNSSDGLVDNIIEIPQADHPHPWLQNHDKDEIDPEEAVDTDLERYL